MADLPPLTDPEWAVVRAQARREAWVREVLVLLAYPGIDLRSEEAAEALESLREAGRPDAPRSS
jgi:hypothetical protein